MNQTQTSKIYIITCVRLVRTAQLPPSFLSRSIRPNTHHAQQSRRISKKHGGRTGADAAAPAAVDDDDDHVNIAEAHSLSLSLSPFLSIHSSLRTCRCRGNNLAAGGGGSKASIFEGARVRLRRDLSSGFPGSPAVVES